MPDDKLKIKISDFCSIGKVEFEIEKGINLIVGKNGSGKSQLLMALAHAYGGQTLLQEYGFDKNIINLKVVQLEPQIKNIFWRPPVRKIADSSRNRKYAAAMSTENYINLSTRHGYTNNVDQRYMLLYDRMANFYLAGNTNKAYEIRRKNWMLLTNSFQSIFSKELSADYTDFGAIIGIKLDDGSISRFNTLSTGELEFIALMLDILTESEVELFLFDEIDTHFHPDLQQKIIGLISEFLKERYVLITTHSPALMLSVYSDRIYYLKPKVEVKPEENQISVISSDYKLLESVTGLYAGFSTDIRMHDLFSNAFYQTTLRFADECARESGVEEAEDKDYDPQISSTRNVLLSFSSPISVLEVGVGKGRLLNAFKAISIESNVRVKYYGIDPVETNLDDTKSFLENQDIPVLEKPIYLETEISKLILDDASIDLCIFANVIHEIAPLNLIEELNQILSKLKEKSKILILEASELVVGEKNFVMFHGTAIKKILERFVNKHLLSLNQANPSTFSKNQILELIITKETNDRLNIESNDVLLGLDEVILHSKRKIKNHITNTETLSSTQLAFYAHNLSNAEIYKDLLG